MRPRSTLALPQGVWTCSSRRSVSRRSDAALEIRPTGGKEGAVWAFKVSPSGTARGGQRMSFDAVADGGFVDLREAAVLVDCLAAHHHALHVLRPGTEDQVGQDTFGREPERMPE